MNLVLGFDIDDVITETSKVLIEAVEKYGEGIDFSDPRTSKKEILRGRAATPEVKAFFRKYGTEACRTVELKEGADRVIRELKRRGIPIHLITARDEQLMPGVAQATIDYFAEKDIPYNQLHVGIHNKKELCEELGVTHLTDDSIDTCRSLVDSRTKPILFATQVNEEFDAGDIQRVDDWDEIERIIINLLEKEKEQDDDER